jgi:hypothetical protein
MTDRITRAIKELKAARDILTPKEVWIKGAYENGVQVCAIGALRRARRGIEFTNNCAHEYLMKAVRKVAPNTAAVEAYNDRRSTKHKDILALFDSAIADAERMAKGSKEAPQ